MQRISRRQFMATTAAGATLANGARAQNLSPAERNLYEAAKREGELTWYSGQVNSETGEAVGRAFTERYPGVKVNVVRSTSQVAFQRLSQDMQAGVAQCDMFSSTDYGHYLFLKREGRLMQYRPQNADGLLAPVRDQDKDNFWQVFYLGLYLLVYNTQKVKLEDAPKSWNDVLNPKWKGQLAIGHPGYSGAIGVFGVVIKKLYGWDWFEKLEKNKPQIGRSSDDPVTLLNAGERTIGVCVSLALPLLNKARGNPLEIVYPTDGTLAVYSPSAIPKNAPHPNAAKLFMEFATGPGYAEVMRKFYVMPVRGDVPPPEGAKPIDQVKLITATPQEIETGVPDIKEAWRDTFGV